MVKAIVGANWGDEGKGKITDMLAEESDIIVRFQGGANAGHTIINDYGKFALHLLPSGVFYNHTTSVIGNGVALNIPYLVKELKSLTDRNVPMPKILVSDRAQILMPYHVAFDTYEEARLAGKSFGSPCRSSPAARFRSESRGAGRGRDGWRHPSPRRRGTPRTSAARPCPSGRRDPCRRRRTAPGARDPFCAGS